LTERASETIDNYKPATASITRYHVIFILVLILQSWLNDGLVFLEMYESWENGWSLLILSCSVMDILRLLQFLVQTYFGGVASLRWMILRPGHRCNTFFPAEAEQRGDLSLLVFKSTVTR
jgi:hypothetical protein